MAQTYPFYIDGRAEGRLRAEPLGQRTLLTITARDSGEGLYKAFVRGSAGRLPLGSLLPQEGQLYLKQSVSSHALEDIGPIKAGEGILAFPSPAMQTIPQGWQREGSPKSLFRDPVLRHALEGATGALVRSGQGQRLLALPLYGGAYPLTPLFCLSCIRALDGRDYAVFAVDGNGIPQIPLGV